MPRSNRRGTKRKSKKKHGASFYIHAPSSAKRIRKQSGQGSDIAGSPIKDCDDAALRVLNYKTVNGKLFYYIEWKNSWTLEESCSNCKRSIRKYFNTPEGSDKKAETERQMVEAGKSPRSYSPPDNETDEPESSSSSSDAEGIKDTEEEPEYCVKEVVNCKFEKGKRKFCLKWKNSWIREDICDKFYPEVKKELMDKYLSTPEGKARKAEIEHEQRFPNVSNQPDAEQEEDSETFATSDNNQQAGPSDRHWFESSSSEDEEQIGDDDSFSSSSSGNSAEEKFGFDKGYEPERILGATNEFNDGALMFLIKWRGVIEADLVPAEEANLKCPQLVIDFYEERIVSEPNSDQPEIVLPSHQQ